MRVVIFTTSAEMGENGRIAEEIKNLGYESVFYDLSEFEYSIVDGKVNVEGVEVRSDDVVIPRAIFSSLHAICTFTLSLRKEGIKVFDNNLLVHKYSINKLSDFIKLAKANIPVPESYHLHSYEKFESIAGKLGFPFIIKLTRTGKGSGIYKIDNLNELKEFIEIRENEGIEAKRYLLQKFVDYKYDLRVLIIGEKIFCMQRIPKENEFRANFSLGGSVEVFDLSKDDEGLARRAMEAVNLEIAGVDLLIGKDDRRFILEVNHTPGMLGMEKATGLNITKIYLEYALSHAR